MAPSGCYITAMKSLSVALAAATLLAGQTAPHPRPTWQTEFQVAKSDLGPTGRNSFFVLEAGHVATYEGGNERLVITVTDQTRVVDGVTTRLVEERETHGGQLAEVSRNYFAIHSATHDVYYFGEDVDNYKGGKVANHEGAWLAGEKGAKFGLMMPAEPKAGVMFYQEMAPKIAMDRAAIVALNAIVKTPAGEFKDCVKVEETTPLEPGVKEYKFYARGAGLVQDGNLKLVK
jgi:hypothetical protein